MLLAPGDGGRWQGCAAAAIVLVNGLIYLTQYIPFRFRNGRDPGITSSAIANYITLAFAALVGMTFILELGVLP